MLELHKGEHQQSKYHYYDQICGKMYHHCRDSSPRITHHLFGNSCFCLVSCLSTCHQIGVISGKAEGLVHLQSALLVLQRLIVLAQFFVHHPKAVELPSNIGVVSLKLGLVHLQSSLLELVASDWV